MSAETPTPRELIAKERAAFFRREWTLITDDRMVDKLDLDCAERVIERLQVDCDYILGQNAEAQEAIGGIERRLAAAEGLIRRIADAQDTISGVVVRAHCREYFATADPSKEIV